MFVKVDPVVMQATSITSDSWVLPVLANAAMAWAHVALKFLVLPQSGRHVVSQDERAEKTFTRKVLVKGEESRKPLLNRMGERNPYGRGGGREKMR